MYIYTYTGLTLSSHLFVFSGPVQRPQPGRPHHDAAAGAGARCAAAAGGAAHRRACRYAPGAARPILR